MSEVKPTPAEVTDITSTAAPAPTTSEPTAEAVESKPETETAPVVTETTTAEPDATTAVTGEVEAEAEPAKELEPITEGVLETKVSFIPIYFKKYTYYFSEEPIPADHLGEYLKKGSTRASQANYAHATQTGKGLLFFTKADKTKPVGIIRLDGAEVVTQGDKKFTIKGPDHETHLEASTVALRQQWVATLKTKIGESEGAHAAVAETEGYKTALEKFKPVTLPAAAAVVKEKKEEVEEKKEEKEEEDEDKKAKKAAKKAKKEDKKKEREAKKAAGETVEDSSSDSDSDSDADEPSTAAAAAAKAEKKKEEKKEKRSASKTRNRFSFFGGKKEKEEKKEEEAPAPVAEVKEETPATTETAPVVAPIVTEPVVATEPAPTTETAAEVPKEEEPKTETSPVASPKTNRKSFLGSLPFLKKKDDKKPETPAEETAKSPDPVPEVLETTEAQPLTSTKGSDPQSAEPPVGAPTVTTEEPAKTETPAEGSKSPALGLVDNIKGHLLGKKEEKKEDKLPDAGVSKDEPAAVEPATEAPKDTEPTEAPRDRKSSFFGSLRRDKSTDGTEDKVKRSLSFWKKEKKPAGKEEAPVSVPEGEAATEPVAVVEPVKTEPATKEAAPVAVPDTTGPATDSEVVDGRIGDVVSAAVTVGGEPSKVA